MTLSPFRACSTLVLKSIDDNERIIEGTASTARTDAAGDVLEPRGASYLLPMPLLMQHDRDRPVGEVRAVKVSDSGISIRARIAKDSGLAYVEDAWRQLRAGLVKGLSIGAQPLAAEPIVDRAGRQTGYRYTAWRWLELSAVTLPMNSDATIAMVRAFDPWGADKFSADRDPLADHRDHELVLDELNQSARARAATRAHVEATMAATRRVLAEVARTRPIAALNALARPGPEASPDYATCRARAEAAMVVGRKGLADAARSSAHNRVLYRVAQTRALVAATARLTGCSIGVKTTP
jgi:HK97 family phage prohead protease